MEDHRNRSGGRLRKETPDYRSSERTCKRLPIPYYRVVLRDTLCVDLISPIIYLEHGHFGIWRKRGTGVMFMYLSDRGHVECDKTTTLLQSHLLRGCNKLLPSIEHAVQDIR